MRYVIGITGASGSIYAKKLIENLCALGHDIYLVCTENGEKVFQYELDLSIDDFIKTLNGKLYRENNDNLFSPVASGSFDYEAVIIVPCSMASIGSIATGSGHSLLHRCCDVTLKEDRKLILVPRETPLSTISLKNMYALSNVGATILPAMPGFYSKPESLEELTDFVVGKILDALKVEHNLYKKWGEK